MEDRIIDLLVEICEDELVRENLDMDLFESGMMDSLAFAELIFGLEDKYGIVISPSEIKRENMNTPRKILAEVRLRS
nr:D-alanine--poly(phosphoribitol) ligase subunit DltC [uncultured Oscillibacter sp.]